jgi:hypothetical protein
MTDTNQLPDDVCSLKQLLLQRDATLKAVRAAMRGAQLHLDQLALLLEQSPQVQLPTEARARVAMASVASGARRETAPNFAGSDCTCLECMSAS